MHWKLKAVLQNAVARLPEAASYATYYWLQRHWGGLRRFTPLSALSTGIETWRRLEEQGVTPMGKVFLEIGTGRVPLAPLAYWLMGAHRTITLDLHPYVREDLVLESVAWLMHHQEEVEQLFGSRLDHQRLAALRDCWKWGRPGTRRGQHLLADVLECCDIRYLAPGDATMVPLFGQSIDFHTSTNVLEHIPLEGVQAILQEGNRLIRPGGLFIHQIDYSDHFSHSDSRLSPIHFLQYSEKQWARYAGNKYMYMNRLRHDDLLTLFADAGHDLVADDPYVDPHLLAGLTQGTCDVHARFRGKSPTVLATTRAWVITQAGGA
jgi:SAM-dependent methyltransferase